MGPTELRIEFVIGGLNVALWCALQVKIELNKDFKIVVEPGAQCTVCPEKANIANII